ncbi:MAG: PKD domain-containing protein [Patescibacteria group bacterium UBA2103]
MIRSLLLFCIFPHLAFAGVYISEVAWMGDGESANNEWIELYSSESVDLGGWSLSALDGTPSISLEGTIDGAFVIYRGTNYSGALENSGEVLILSDASGAEIDRVDGGDGWSIGGDNDSKETAQFIDGSWITASPTPGSVSFAEETVVESVSSAGGSTYTPAHLVIDIPDVIEVVAGDDHIFEVGVGNSEGATYTGALVSWNFGDGSSLSGNKIYHRYPYAGEYVAYVHVRYGNEEFSKKVLVVVRDADISFSVVDQDKVEIINGDDTELDISHWRITDGSNVFMFPAHSYVGNESSVFISSAVAGFNFGEDTVLTYPNGEEVLRTEEEVIVSPQVVYVPAPVVEEVLVEEDEAPLLPAAAVVADEAAGGLSIWVYAWVLVVLLAGGSIVYVRKARA